MAASVVAVADDDSIEKRRIKINNDEVGLSCIEPSLTTVENNFPNHVISLFNVGVSCNHPYRCWRIM